MSFIGIISNKNEKQLIKKINDKVQDITIIEINEKSIDNIKNIKFNVILIKENSNILKNKILQIENILKRAQYIIINSDIEIDFKVFVSESTKVLTYGFNSKATITASSITEENILVCIQRNIINIKGKIIEPQEIIKRNKKEFNVLDILAISSIEIIYENDNIL